MSKSARLDKMKRRKRWLDYLRVVVWGDNPLSDTYLHIEHPHRWHGPNHYSCGCGVHMRWIKNVGWFFYSATNRG